MSTTRKGRRGIEPAAGLHDFDGSCAPEPGRYHWAKTFSVGVFAYVERAGGKGLKRGHVAVRVRGATMAHERIYARAREICEALDAGAYDGPDNVRVTMEGWEA